MVIEGWGANSASETSVNINSGKDSFSSITGGCAAAAGSCGLAETNFRDPTSWDSLTVVANSPVIFVEMSGET